MTDTGECGAAQAALDRVGAWLDRKTSFESLDFKGRLDIADDTALYVSDLRIVLAAAEFGLGQTLDPDEFAEGVDIGGDPQP